MTKVIPPQTPNPQSPSPLLEGPVSTISVTFFLVYYTLDTCIYIFAYKCTCIQFYTNSSTLKNYMQDTVLPCFHLTVKLPYISPYRVTYSF